MVLIVCGHEKDMDFDVLGSKVSITPKIILLVFGILALFYFISSYVIYQLDLLSLSIRPT